MAKLRFLRGDGAGRVRLHRRAARWSAALIEDYFATVAMLLDGLDAWNVALAAEIASVPEHIRGYGHVKEAHLHPAKQREAELLAKWKTPAAQVASAA